MSDFVDFVRSDFGRGVLCGSIVNGLLNIGWSEYRRWRERRYER